MSFISAPYQPPIIPHQQYENRIVAFIDVLGFSSMVAATSKNQKRLQNLTSALNSFYNLIWEWEADGVKSSFAFTQFSDSIVVSAIADTVDSFDMLLQVMRGIVKLVSDYGIIVRGGIAQGQLIHDENMLIGPAMVEAYDLESKKALYPRIIIDEKLKNYFFESLDDFLSDIKIPSRPDWDNIFAQDKDGLWFLNYINPSLTYLQGTSSHSIKDYQEVLHDIVDKGKNSNNKQVVEKYKWLEEKLSVT